MHAIREESDEGKQSLIMLTLVVASLAISKKLQKFVLHFHLEIENSSFSYLTSTLIS